MSDTPCDTASRESSAAPKAQLHTPGNTPAPEASITEADITAFHNERLPDVLKISKSKGAAVLDQHFSTTGGLLHFQNLADAKAVIGRNSWAPPVNDDTIPQDEAADRVVVKRLVEAFCSMEYAKDTNGNAYRKRFTMGYDVAYEPWVIEACAWETLRMVKNLHVNGLTVPILDSEILRQIGQTEHWTFEVRVSMICRVLKTSKSVAVTLMKQEKTMTIIGAPHKLYLSTIVNTASNKKRNRWVKDGRQADAQRAANATANANPVLVFTPGFTADDVPDAKCSRVASPSPVSLSPTGTVQLSGALRQNIAPIDTGATHTSAYQTSPFLNNGTTVDIIVRPNNGDVAMLEVPAPGLKQEHEHVQGEDHMPEQDSSRKRKRSITLTNTILDNTQVPVKVETPTVAASRFTPSGLMGLAAVVAPLPLNMITTPAPDNSVEQDAARLEAAQLLLGIGYPLRS